MKENQLAVLAIAMLSPDPLSRISSHEEGRVCQTPQTETHQDFHPGQTPRVINMSLGQATRCFGENQFRIGKPMLCICPSMCGLRSQSATSCRRFRTGEKTSRLPTGGQWSRGSGLASWSAAS